MLHITVNGSFIFTYCITCFWDCLTVQQLYDEHNSAKYAKPVRVRCLASTFWRWFKFVTKPSGRRHAQRGMSTAAHLYQYATVDVPGQTCPIAGSSTRRRHIRRRHTGVSVGRDEFQRAVHAWYSQLETDARSELGRGRARATVVANGLAYDTWRCVGDTSHAKYTGRQWRRGGRCSGRQRNRLSPLCRLQSNWTSLACIAVFSELLSSVLHIKS